MLRLSKKTDYALLALRYLDREAPAGVASARAIAKHYDIPVDLLAKVLQQLARVGFLAASKGVHGGYHITRPTNTISVAEIVEAIDGPLAMTACSPGDERCDQYATCTIRDPLWRIKERIASMLRTVTLADITEPEAAPVVFSKGDPNRTVAVEAQ